MIEHTNISFRIVNGSKFRFSGLIDKFKKDESLKKNWQAQYQTHAETLGFLSIMCVL